MRKRYQVTIDARLDEQWLQKAQEALAGFHPLRLIGDDEQILEFLKYKRSKAGKWTTEGTLTLEPPPPQP